LATASAQKDLQAVREQMQAEMLGKIQQIHAKTDQEKATVQKVGQVPVPIDDEV